MNGLAGGDGRVRALLIAVAACLVALAVQLARVQLAPPQAADEPADPRALRVRALHVEAPRGLVLDRNGAVLARNVPAYELALVPGELPTGGAERRRALLAVERRAGVPLAELERRIEGGLAAVDPFAPVAVRAGLEREEAIALRAAFAGLPGVRVRARAVRVYEGGELLPHVLGHVGPIPAGEAEAYLAAGYRLDARVGIGGVEEAYEDALRGEPGSRLVLADPAGRELERLGEVAPAPGADLVLSVDLVLQAAAAAALGRGIEAGAAAAVERWPQREEPPRRTGAAVVLDVRTGELLALVTSPSYGANAFSGLGGDEAARLFADESRPLVHRAYQEAPPPGSIFKPLVGAAALEEGVATPATRIRSTGAISVRSVYDPDVVYRFRDWAAHGTLDFYGGLTRSSDVYYYCLAGGHEDACGGASEGLGADRVAAYARAFGLGAPTGLDLPGETAGLVPDGEWKREALGEPWVLADTYQLGIGQGYLQTTPLQMAVAAAALANGGGAPAPRVALGVRAGGGFEPLPRPAAGALPIAGAHLDVVREALRRTANKDLGGTGWRGQPEGMTIAAKTGTAEFGPSLPRGPGDEHDEYDTHGWFLSFAPWAEPEIAVVVYLEHGEGAAHAAPVAREIIEAYFGREAAPSVGLRDASAAGGEPPP